MTSVQKRTLAILFLSTAAALAQNAAKPDLNAGGAHPSLIPNHQTSEVRLPGFHLSGTTVTVDGVCTLASYKVVSDTEISMRITGNRAIDDKDNGCFLHVHQGKTTVGTWIVVDLTEAEQKQKDNGQRQANLAKATSYISNLGTQWNLRFSDGASETLTAQAPSPGELPDFTSSSGGIAKIAITDGNKVVIITESCMLSGTLSAGQVKNGISMGSCEHTGSWTAQMK